MRIMPFMKRKNGVQFAGIGLDTSSGGGGGGGSVDIYDGQEHLIGKWFADNLYVRAVHATITGTGTVVANIGAFKECVVAWGASKQGSYEQFRNIASQGANTILISATPSTGNVVINYDSTYYNNGIVNLIIYYTKEEYNYETHTGRYTS